MFYLYFLAVHNTPYRLKMRMRERNKRKGCGWGCVEKERMKEWRRGKFFLFECF